MYCAKHDEYYHSTWLDPPHRRRAAVADVATTGLASARALHPNEFVTQGSQQLTYKRALPPPFAGGESSPRMSVRAQCVQYSVYQCMCHHAQAAARWTACRITAPLSPSHPRRRLTPRILSMYIASTVCCVMRATAVLSLGCIASVCHIADRVAVHAPTKAMCKECAALTDVDIVHHGRLDLWFPATVKQPRTFVAISLLNLILSLEEASIGVSHREIMRMLANMYAKGRGHDTPVPRDCDVNSVSGIAATRRILPGPNSHWALMQALSGARLALGSAVLAYKRYLWPQHE